MTNTHPIITDLEQQFISNANPARAIQQAAYLKHNGKFFGLPKPLVDVCILSVYKTHIITSEQELIVIITLLWQKEQREFHYTAMTLAYKYKKLWSTRMLSIFESMIRSQPWWDTADTIASRLVGSLIQKYPELITQMDLWIKDDFLWIRRSALLSQLFFKEKTDYDRLFAYIKLTAHEKDFFIRKAIGWVLRQYSKTNSLAIKEFINDNKYQLSTLSIKEGSKYI